MSVLVRRRAFFSCARECQCAHVNMWLRAGTARRAHGAGSRDARCGGERVIGVRDRLCCHRRVFISRGRAPARPGTGGRLFLSPTPTVQLYSTRYRTQEYTVGVGSSEWECGVEEVPTPCVLLWLECIFRSQRHVRCAKSGFARHSPRRRAQRGWCRSLTPACPPYRVSTRCVAVVNFRLALAARVDDGMGCRCIHVGMSSCTRTRAAPAWVPTHYTH